MTEKHMGQTQYSMAYGLEVVIPIKISIPTTTLSGYDLSNNEKNQCTTLELLDEQCDKAKLHNETYKQSVT